MSTITQGYVTATQVRAEVENTTSGVYTWSSYVNTALVTNTSGGLVYARLLTGANVVLNGDPTSRANWVGILSAGTYSFDGRNLSTSLDGDGVIEVAGSLTVGKDYFTSFEIVS